MWRAEDPQGFEASKIRFEVLPYTMGSTLDIGCGNDKLWPHAFGVDSMLDTHLFGVPMKPEMVVPDARRLPFRDDEWDAVFSSHTLEHIADFKAALLEWWRVVRVGGHLCLYLPDRRAYPNIGEAGANPDHKHDFVPDDIVDAMKELAPDWALLECQDRHAGREYSFLVVFRKEYAGRGHSFPAYAPKPEKTAGVLRPGGHGDALWAASVCAHLKEQGYHVTLYSSAGGAEVLRHDPHIDRLIALRRGCPSDEQEIDFCIHEGPKYDLWVNLLHSVETDLLPHPSNHRFFLPHALRHRLMNVNYLDRVHLWAGLEGVEPRQKFYPTDLELATAKKARALLGEDGPLVVINPAGSGPVKYWPHAQRLMEILAERGVYSVVLGDVRDERIVGVEKYGHVVGMEWPIRLALTYATLADAVVATESAIANAVAFEPVFKVVTLSHSSVENLTRDWMNCASIEPQGLKCYPCHRVHGADFAFCARDRNTGASACQAMASAEVVAGIVLEHLERAGKLPKKAA